MKIGFLNEISQQGEQRVAIVPQAVQLLAKQGIEWFTEAGAGFKAGYDDAAYQAQGVKVLKTADEVLEAVEMVIHISPNTFEKIAAKAKTLNRTIVSVGMVDSLWEKDRFKNLGSKNLVSFSLDLMPRISRAQSMDVLSSMSTISGYKAVLLAAQNINKIFPMLTTAAGTVPAAKVLVIGVGVAGLQAMATAKRLGAVVSGYDVRLATVEQIQSVGAKSVLSAEHFGEGTQEKQKELLANAIADSDAVITTALIPGGRAPILITQTAVSRMKPGSCIIDLAAERGGNCELTVKGETKIEFGVNIVGPVNLPSTAAFQASQMYTKNISSFLKLALKNGKLNLDLNDEILKSTMISPVENLDPSMLASAERVVAEEAKA